MELAGAITHALDNFRSIAGSVAAGHGYVLHAWRIYPHSAGSRRNHPYL